MTTFEKTSEGSFIKVCPAIFRDPSTTDHNLKSSKYLRSIHERDEDGFCMFYYSQLSDFSFDADFIEVHEFTVNCEDEVLKIEKRISHDLANIEAESLNQFPAFFTGESIQMEESTIKEDRFESRLVSLGGGEKFPESMKLTFISNDKEWISLDYFGDEVPVVPAARIGHSFIKPNERYGYLYGGFISWDDVEFAASNDKVEATLFEEHKHRGKLMLSNELWRFNFRTKTGERCLSFEVDGDLSQNFSQMLILGKKIPSKQLPFEKEIEVEDQIFHEVRKYQNPKIFIKPGCENVTNQVGWNPFKWRPKDVERRFMDFTVKYPPSKAIKQNRIIDIYDKKDNCIYYIGNEYRCSIDCLTLSIFNLDIGMIHVHELRKRISTEYLICDALKDSLNNTIVIFSNKTDNSAGYVITVYCLKTHMSKSFQTEFLDTRMSLNVQNFQLKFIDNNKKLMFLGGNERDQTMSQQIHAIYVIDWHEYRSRVITPWLEMIREGY